MTVSGTQPEQPGVPTGNESPLSAHIAGCYVDPTRSVGSGRPKRVLVVGWGFLGAAVGDQLWADGMAVIGLTRSASPRTREANERGIEIIMGDASDPSIVEGGMADVDHVVFAAGGLLPPMAARRPIDDAVGTLSPLICMLELLRERPSVGLTYLSSGGTVYGNPVRTPTSETDPTLPIGPYGVSRLAAEQYAQMYSRTFGFPLQLVRCANVYGPGQDPNRSQGAVAVFLHRVVAGLPLQIVGDGSAIRDYIHIYDVANAVSSLVASRHDVGVVNLGSGRGHRVLEVAELVSHVVGRPAILEFAPARSTDVAAIVLDVTKLSSVIPFAPMGLRKGLRQMWRSLAALSLAPIPQRLAVAPRASLLSPATPEREIGAVVS